MSPAAPAYVYSATVWKPAYDADTVYLNIDLGFGVELTRQTFRLYGINAPEMRGPERDDGRIARDWMREQMNGAEEIIVRTHKERDGRDGKGKFGRWLAEIFADGVNLNAELVRLGMAVEKEY